MTTAISTLKTRLPAPLSTALLVLLALLYGPLLLHWVDGWLNKSISIQHEYFSHGLLGIPFAAYLTWTYRDRWQRLSAQIHPAGLALLAIAAVFYLSGLTDWMNLSFPLMLAGLCLSIKGLPGLKLLGFPLALVVFATPSQLPYLIEPYALPLQKFIASVAGFILLQGGIDVTVQEIYLQVNDQMVEVAPHCAGLKMLFTSLYVALMLTYWTGLWRSRLQTGLFFISTVAVSVTANIIRNALLSYFHGVENKAAFDWLHESWGGDMYSAIMLLMLIVIIRLIQNHVPKSIDLKVAGSSTV
jgi:cyanoexosortase B